MNEKVRKWPLRERGNTPNPPSKTSWTMATCRNLSSVHTANRLPWSPFDKRVKTMKESTSGYRGKHCFFVISHSRWWGVVYTSKKNRVMCTISFLKRKNYRCRQEQLKKLQITAHRFKMHWVNRNFTRIKRKYHYRQVSLYYDYLVVTFFFQEILSSSFFILNGMMLIPENIFFQSSVIKK